GMEAIDGDDVGDADRAVGDAAGDGIAVARSKLAFFIADAKPHPAGYHVTDLLMRMRVSWHLGARPNRELHDHHLIAAAQNSSEHAGYGFGLGPVGGGVVRASCQCHANLARITPSS